MRQLSGYVGEGQKIARVQQANYTSAQLAMVRFDQSFWCLPYDARRRKICREIFYKCTFNFQTPVQIGADNLFLVLIGSVFRCDG